MPHLFVYIVTCDQKIEIIVSTYEFLKKKTISSFVVVLQAVDPLVAKDTFTVDKSDLVSTVITYIYMYNAYFLEFNFILYICAMGCRPIQLCSSLADFENNCSQVLHLLLHQIIVNLILQDMCFL